MEMFRQPHNKLELFKGFEAKTLVVSKISSKLRLLKVKSSQLLWQMFVLKGRAARVELIRVNFCEIMIQKTKIVNAFYNAQNCYNFNTKFELTSAGRAVWKPC